MNRDALLDVSDPRFTQAWVERAGTGAVEAELTFIRRDGARFEARVSSKLFTDETGCEIACTSIHDITERKQAEEALRQSEEHFRATFEHVPVGISERTLEGRFINANPKHLELHGYTKDELVHLTIMDVTHPGDMGV